MDSEIYKLLYKTPGNMSDIIIESDGEVLTRLYFEGCRDSLRKRKIDENQRSRCDVRNDKAWDYAISTGFSDTVRWLDIYFSGKVPNFTPRYRITDGLTDFRKKVLKILSEIPYGCTVTYGDIAKKIDAEAVENKENAAESEKKYMSSQAVGGTEDDLKHVLVRASEGGMKHMSAQAVGGAVGWNPIGIIIPCHRVLGASGSLTGYGGGISNKKSLLRLEGAEFRDNI